MVTLRATKLKRTNLRQNTKKELMITEGRCLLIRLTVEGALFLVRNMHRGW